MAGILESLGQGLSSAGGILSPRVYEDQQVTNRLLLQQQEQQKQLAQQQQQFQAQQQAAVASEIIKGFQNGSIDPNTPQGQQAAQVLQQMGIPGMGPTPVAQQHMQGLQFDKMLLDRMRGLQTGQPQGPTPTSIPPDVPSLRTAAEGGDMSGSPDIQSLISRIPAEDQGPARAQLASQPPAGMQQSALTAPQAASPNLLAGLPPEALLGPSGTKLRELQQEMRLAQKPPVAPLVRSFAISDTQKREMQSLDGGRTWNPVPGSVPEKITKPTAEETPFMKEGAALDKLDAEGKGDTPAAKRLRAKLEGSDLDLSKDPETTRFMAEHYWAGDRSVFANLGRGAQGAKNVIALRREVMMVGKKQGLTAKDLAAAAAEFQGMIAGERTLGTRQAQIELAANVTKQFAPIAVAASEAFDRTPFKSLNDVEKAALSRTASPELRRFNFANLSLINAYARAINPQGVGNQADKDHAREVLDTGFSKGDYRAAVDQLQIEMSAELKAPGAVKGQMREFFTGKEALPKTSDVVAPTSADEKARLKAKYGLQ